MKCDYEKVLTEVLFIAKSLSGKFLTCQGFRIYLHYRNGAAKQLKARSLYRFWEHIVGQLTGEVRATRANSHVGGGRLTYPPKHRKDRNLG